MKKCPVELRNAMCGLNTAIETLKQQNNKLESKT